jgi:Mg2+ and Co2+ transporter CorA
MAGIFGMNFVNRPVLHGTNAYYGSLAAMAAIAVVLLIVFYYHGWLTQ